MKSISELNKKHPLHLLIYINYTYILISYQILTELSKLFDNARNINETRGKTEKNQKPKKKKRRNRITSQTTSSKFVFYHIERSFFFLLDVYYFNEY